MFTRRASAADSKTMSQAPPLEHQLQDTVSAPLRLAALPQGSTGVPAAAPPPLPAAPSAQSPAAEANNHSVIGEDLTIEGQSITIRCRGTLEINGNIQAELHSQKLMVGKSGKVEGVIAAEAVEVWGHVSGTIMGTRVALHPGAEVEGDIHAKTLAIADGANFEGRSRKVTDLATIAPRLDASAPAPTANGALPVPVPMSKDLAMQTAANA